MYAVATFSTASKLSACNMSAPPSPAIALLNTPNPKQALVREELAERYASPERQPWFKTFVLTFAATGDLTNCAQALGQPKALLVRAMQVPEFDKMLRAAVQEQSSEASAKLLRGTRLDSILTLIKLRDDDKIRPDLRAKICFWFLTVNIGTNAQKAGLGDAEGDLSELLKRSGGDIQKGIDDDIKRLLRSNPALANLVTDAVRPTPANVSEPEANWQGPTRDVRPAPTSVVSSSTHA